MVDFPHDDKKVTVTVETTKSGLPSVCVGNFRTYQKTKSPRSFIVGSEVGCSP